jgi:sarcosine oxidase subunit beta
MFAPMTGLLLSEVILNEPTTIDLRDLHIDRFKTNSRTTYEHSVV